MQMDMIMSEKSCSNCKHSKNVRIFNDETEWFCEVTPFNHIDLAGSYNENFTKFYCSLWEDVFKKENK